MCLRYEINEHLDVLCDCESWHRCEWHERLKQREDHAVILQAMKDELFDRHLAFAIEHGFVDPPED